MNSTKIIVSALLGFFINAASAQQNSANIGYTSDYFYRGASIAEESVQSSISSSYELSSVTLSAGAFTNQAVENGSDVYILTAGASKSFADDLVSVYGGLNHFENVDGASLFEFAVSADLSVPLSPTVNLYRSFDDDLFTWEIGVSHKFDLEVAGICLHALYGESELTEALESDYFTAGANLSKAISDNAEVILSADYVDSDVSEDEWVFGGAVSINF